MNRHRTWRFVRAFCRQEVSKSQPWSVTLQSGDVGNKWVDALFKRQFLLDAVSVFGDVGCGSVAYDHAATIRNGLVFVAISSFCVGLKFDKRNQINIVGVR